MAAIRPRQRRRSSSLGLWIGMPMFLLLTAGVAVGTLLATGIMPWPWAEAGPSGPPPGSVAIPAAARPIPAYTAVKLEHLVDPNTAQIKWMYLPEESVPPEAILSPTEIVGRVMKRDKSPGYAFQEAEFLPTGTRSGVVGGIPPGKRAMTLDASRIGGIHALRAGDHLDLLASAPIDEKKFRGEHAGLLQARNLASSAVGQADVRVIVHDGVIVSPVTTRGIPTTTSSLTEGARTTMTPVQEVVIAVDPAEVAPLNEAFALEMNVMAVARSGHPDYPGAKSITPGSKSPDETTVTELIVGGRRENIVFRRDPSDANHEPATPNHEPPVSTDAIGDEGASQAPTLSANEPARN